VDGWNAAITVVPILLVYSAHRPTIDLYNNEKRRPKPKSQTDGIDDLCPTLTARPFHQKITRMTIISIHTIANIKSLGVLFPAACGVIFICE